MAPHPYPSTNGSLIEVPRQEHYSIKSSSPSSFSEIIVAIVFGLCALAIGTITIWQSHKAWKIWHATYGHDNPAQDARLNPDFDVELGDPAPASAPAPVRDQPPPGSNLQLSTSSQTTDPVSEYISPRLSSDMQVPAQQSSVPMPADQPQSQVTLNTGPLPPPRRSSVAVNATPSPQSLPMPFLGGRPVIEQDVKDNPGLVA